MGIGGLGFTAQLADLATGAFLTEASNIVLLGPSGTGKTHLAARSSSRRPSTGSRASRSPTLAGGCPGTGQAALRRSHHDRR
jgi:AAA+ superfamily predicted ATPase